MISKKLKHGDIRTDGFRFYAYKRRNGKLIEHWANPASFEKMRENRRIAQRKLKAEDPDKYREYRERNRAGARTSQVRYRNSKPEVIVLHQIKRSRRLKISNPQPADPKKIRQFYLMSKRLTACTGFLWHVDHIRALAKGGPHHESNLQVLPAKVNLRKGSR